MMQINPPNWLVRNLMWFLASLLMAFIIWFFAITQSDPIQTARFDIDIIIEPPDGTILTNEPRQSVQVDVRAQQSVINLLTEDDITVRADLDALGPGQHAVPLDATIARPASVDTRPRQITVVLETVEIQEKPIAITISEEQAIDLAVEDIIPAAMTATVSGSENQVARIVAVEGALDLSEVNSSFTRDVMLIPVDEQGDTVEDVTIDPQTVSVSVGIVPRDDVKQVSVSPNLREETLPNGYSVVSISLEPQIVFLNGSPETLARLGTTIRTDAINLADRLDDFEITVPLDLPNNDLIILGEQTNVTVSIGIVAQTTVEQFDDVPVEIRGQTATTTFSVDPPTVSVVLTGPEVLLDSLSVADIQVLVDVNSLDTGRYDLTPNIVIQQGQVAPDTVDRSVIPAEVTVQVGTTD